MYTLLQQWDSQTTAALYEEYIDLGKILQLPCIPLPQFLRAFETFLEKAQVF